MPAAKAYLSSTVGRKQLTAIAGLGLCLFVLTHVLGNFLLFVSPQAYNTYSHRLISNPLIYVAEVGLVAIFVLHAVLALLLYVRNRAARKSPYAVTAGGEKGTSAISKTLVWQGVVVLVFVILHLITFKYGTHYSVSYEGEEMRDLHRLVAEVFQSPAYVTWYVFAVTILGFHLAHGLGSSLQSLGMNHEKYNCWVRVVSLVYGLIIGLGFAAQPLYMFFVNQG